MRGQCRKAPYIHFFKEETQMKKNKVLLTVVCAVLLVAASVMGTLAYLTSTDEVKNTFSVGNVKITLDEAKVGADGKALTGDSAARVKSNDYKLLPGHEYDKDPVVHVDAASEDCYLFVKVVNEIAAIEDSTNTIASQMAAKGWKALGTGYDNIYVYVGTATGATDPLAVAAGSDVTVFEKVKVDGSVNNATLAGYASKTITVTAYAVQKDGFEGKTATAIWTAAFGA